MHYNETEYILGLVFIWLWGVGMSLVLRWLPGKIEGWLAGKPVKKETVARKTIIVINHD
jgi:hypothetical protein